MSDAMMNIQPATPEPFGDLPAIAARLGVEPNTGGDVMLTLADGRSYSLFGLMGAFLDRIDAATKA